MALTAKERREARKGKKKSALRRRFEYNQNNQKVYVPKSARKGVKVPLKNIPPAEREIAETRRSDGGEVYKHDDASQAKVIKQFKKEQKKRRDLRIGQQLAKQFKQDDKDIAEAKKNPKKTYNTKGQEVEAVFEDGKYVTRVKEDPKKPKLDPKPKKTEADERAAWEKKTRNSPARRSGAWDADELWEKQKAHRKWESDRKEGKLKREKFDPRKPRGTQRKLVQKTPAELEAERRKKEVKAAKNNKSTNKISETVKVKERKNKEREFSVNSFPGSFNIA